MGRAPLFARGSRILESGVAGFLIHCGPRPWPVFHICSCWSIALRTITSVYDSTSYHADAMVTCHE